jgi:hypothetical protein
MDLRRVPSDPIKREPGMGSSVPGGWCADYSALGLVAGLPAIR